ncbi:MAG: SCO family protein [Myxococcaceae bacterium]
MRTVQGTLAALVGRPLFWVLAVGLLAGWPLVSGLLRKPPPVPGVLGSLPPFSLTDASGARLDNASLKGRVWLLGFVDTSCLACAERLGGALERLQYRIRNVGPAVGMLEVALSAPNPVVDVTADMTRRHANPRQWLTASGPDAQRLLGEVGALAFRRGAMLEAGAAVALVDEKGRVRAVESVEAPASMDELVSKLTLILNIH